MGTKLKAFHSEHINNILQSEPERHLKADLASVYRGYKSSRMLPEVARDYLPKKQDLKSGGGAETSE